MEADTDPRSAFAAFATQLGLSDLRLDEHGVAGFTVDERPCHVAEQADRRSFVVTVMLGRFDDTMAPKRLLEANFAAATLGIGTVGLDARLGTLCLVERVPFEGLTGDVLARTLEAIFNRADDWSQLVRDAPQTPAIDTLGSGFLRV